MNRITSTASAASSIARKIPVIISFSRMFKIAMRVGTNVVRAPMTSGSRWAVDGHCPASSPALRSAAA
jgi:hypothetical protein